MIREPAAIFDWKGTGSRFSSCQIGPRGNHSRLAIFPGLAISLLVLCVNLFGDGINDVLNPKLQKK
jgi:hypothetical protein